MVIISPNKGGHYGYYIKLLENRFKTIKVYEYKDLDKIVPLSVIDNENILVLNYWSLFKKKPSFYLYILLNCKLLGQFIYNIDFLYKSNYKSYLLKGLCLILKSIRKVTFFTLVEHDLNIKLGLAYITDPIVLPDKSDPITSVKELFPEIDKVPVKFLLLFGSHDERKGTYEFLKHHRHEFNVFIVGKIHDKRILEFQNKDGIYIYNGFVSDEVKHSLFKSASCVVVPYLNWYGSSGVLGTAISYDKVIIGSSTYFIGKVLKEYNRSLNGNITDLGNISSIEIEKLEKIQSNSAEIIAKYFSETTFLQIMDSWNTK